MKIAILGSVHVSSLKTRGLSFFDLRARKTFVVLILWHLLESIRYKLLLLISLFHSLPSFLTRHFSFINVCQTFLHGIVSIMLEERKKENKIQNKNRTDKTNVAQHTDSNRWTTFLRSTFYKFYYCVSYHFIRAGANWKTVLSCS